MNEAELRVALRSPSPEQRFAAAYLVGERRLNWRKEMLDRLTDHSDAVRQAARRSLVILSFLALNPEEAQRLNSPVSARRVTPLAQLKQPVDFGPPPGAAAGMQKLCVQRWSDWWDKQEMQRLAQSALIAKPERESRDTEAGRLVRTLLQAPVPRRGELLEQYRASRGVQYTEALAFAIPQLDPETRPEARKALRERLSRMTERSLVQYLEDDNVEIRRAAVLGLAIRDFKAQTGRAIDLLLDPEPLVQRAAHTALKELSGKDLGPPLNPTETERNEAVSRWKQWWQGRGNRP